MALHRCKPAVLAVVELHQSHLPLPHLHHHRLTAPTTRTGEARKATRAAPIRGIATAQPTARKVLRGESLGGQSLNTLTQKVVSPHLRHVVAAVVDIEGLTLDIMHHEYSQALLPVNVSLMQVPSPVVPLSQLEPRSQSPPLCKHIPTLYT